MTDANLSPSAKGSGADAHCAAEPLPGAEDFTFRAPRHGDLVACPYCDADTFTCDHCGGERRLYASEVFQ